LGFALKAVTGVQPALERLAWPPGAAPLGGHARSVMDEMSQALAGIVHADKLARLLVALHLGGAALLAPS
jgi:hypothetical protein